MSRKNKKAKEIVRRGRDGTGNRPMRGRTVAALLAVSCLLQYLSFHPAAIWLFGWVGLAPWIFALARMTWLRSLKWSFPLGYAFFLLGAMWLAEVHWGALVVPALALALYYVLFAGLLNFIARKGRVPMTLAVPVAWVTVEFVRSFALTGFPWLYLGHTQFQLLPLIQIADITGAYGVSFVVAAFNGLVADALLFAAGKSPARLSRARLVALSVAVCVLVAAVVVYGVVRLDEVRREMRPGPRLMVVQPNIRQELKSDRENQDSFEVCIDLTLAEIAAAKKRGEMPDLIVWPESIIPPRWYVREGDESGGEEFAPTTNLITGEVVVTTRWYAYRFDNALKIFDTPLFTGCVHVNHKPFEGTWWHSGRKEFIDFKTIYSDEKNSAYYFDKDGRQLGRYDKMHLVPYGEYIAMQDVLPFQRGVINHFAGFVRELKRGSPDQDMVFSLDSRDGSQSWTFCSPICYEIIFPRLVAGMVFDGEKKAAQFVVNVSNDGWFHESAELEQTTVIAAFRAVENRVGVVRATNTGISGFIRPDGAIAWDVEYERDPETGEIVKDFVTGAKILKRQEFLQAPGGGGMKSVEGVITRRVFVSDILTVYSRVKDAFAIAVCVGCGIMLGVSALRAVAGRKKTAAAKSVSRA